MTGNPVVVLPAGSSKDGLPIGIQVVGRRWQDMELLAVAEALTQVTGEFRRPPGY
jgi:amidase